MSVLSLGGEEPLEESMATLSSILARRIPWTQLPVDLEPHYTLIVIHQHLLSDTAHRHHDSSNHKGPKSEQWPESWKFLCLPQNSWNKPPFC